MHNFIIIILICLGCGGAVTAPRGEIHSPQFPNNYPNNADCSWVITVDPGHRILFNFTDMDIEGHTTCDWDYVAVSDLCLVPSYRLWQAFVWPIDFVVYQLFITTELHN